MAMDTDGTVYFIEDTRVQPCAISVDKGECH